MTYLAGGWWQRRNCVGRRIWIWIEWEKARVGPLKGDSEVFIEGHLIPGWCSWPSLLSVIHMQPWEHWSHSYHLLITTLPSLHPFSSSYQSHFFS